MSFRSWASILTVILIAVILFFARHELVRAWELLGSVNLWVLSLIIPAQIAVYFIAGEMMFSYLRDKKAIDNVSLVQQARMALEMNFVNHTLPSAGVSGLSYMTWRLKKYDISPGRATLAQLIRFVVSFAAFTLLLLIALIAITIDGSINRWVIFLSAVIVLLMFGGTFALVTLVSSLRRTRKFSTWTVNVVNNVLTRLKIPKEKMRLKEQPIFQFFEEIHYDYLELKKEKKLLIKPFLWGILFVVGDVLLYMITFWAFGANVNPAPVLIAYGLANIAGFIVVTPGGAGAFETIMVSFLALASVSAGTAIAGILLTRVILLLGTVGFGYLFYQLALIKYGKPKSTA